MQSDELSASEINLIAFDVRDGTANPEDAKRLLAKFCECADANKAIPPRLIEHFREAFHSYLTGRRTTIDAALGLVRTKGRPKVSPQKRIALAAEVLKLRLEGKSHQEAVTKVSELRSVAESIIGEAWRDNRSNGLLWLLRDRILENSPLTSGENDRLLEIFGGEKDSAWFTPGKSEI